MKFKKGLTVVMTAILCAGILAGCSGASANTDVSTKEALNYACTKDIRDINPHLYSGEMSAQNMVFEGLTKNEGGEVKPALAESWDISADGLEYTFHLRKGVTFTDGAAFDAAAVKLNMDVIVANKERHSWFRL